MNKATEIMTIIFHWNMVWAREKVKEQILYAMETYGVMCNYFTTFPLYSLSFTLWDLDPQIVASFKAAILTFFPKNLFFWVGLIFYFSLAFILSPCYYSALREDVKHALKITTDWNHPGGCSIQI